jgi:hypothetical protein
MIPMMKAAYVTVVKAVERGDVDAALETLSRFMPRVRDLHRSLEGTLAHEAIGMAVEQLELLQEALHEGHVPRAKAILESFQISGPELEKLVEQAGKPEGSQRHGEK